MAWDSSITNFATRSTGDTIAAADINTTDDNVGKLWANMQLIGNGTSQPSMTLEALITDVSTFILDHVYKVDDVFVQWPIAASNTIGTAFPTNQRPAARFGGTWAQIWNTDACVFQTEEADETGMQTRTNGLSADQMQGHWHSGYSKTLTANVAGGGTDVYFATSGNNTSANSDMIRAAVQDGTNGTPRVGIRTAHKNRIFLLWKRTA